MTKRNKRKPQPSLLRAIPLGEPDEVANYISANAVFDPSYLAALDVELTRYSSRHDLGETTRCEDDQACNALEGLAYRSFVNGEPCLVRVGAEEPVDLAEVVGTAQCPPRQASPTLEAVPLGEPNEVADYIWDHFTDEDFDQLVAELEMHKKWATEGIITPCQRRRVKNVAQGMEHLCKHISLYGRFEPE